MRDKTFKHLLMRPDFECRLTHGGNLWLYWDESQEEWVIRGQTGKYRKNRVLATAPTEAETVTKFLQLCGEDN